MAAEAALGSDSNGIGPDPNTKTEHLSPAEILMKKHEADLAHRASIEDVVDEEDIIHPPTHETTPGPVLEEKAGSTDGPTGTWAQPMSAKAAGKQKARDETSIDEPKAKTTYKAFDLKSDDAFPSLGSGPRPSVPAAAPAWGMKKSQPSQIHGSNGAHSASANDATTSSNPSSRASTPASGVATPTSAPASGAFGQPYAQRTQGGATLSLPGRPREVADTIVLKSHELLPRDQLKKPVSEIVQSIKKRTGASLQMSTSRSGDSTCIARGSPEAVRKALRDVAKELSAKQSIKLSIPASLRHRIIGNKQGVTIQGIQQRSGTRVHVPRPEEPTSTNEDDYEIMIDVVIEGDALGVKIASDEILSIVNDHTSNVNLSLKGIPAEFYPFIAGPNGARTAALEEGRNVRIHIPHYYTWTTQPPPTPSAPNQSPTFSPAIGIPIRVLGDRLAAQQAREEIERWVEELRRQIAVEEISVDRGRHRFILGGRGDLLHDFLQETGCAVVLPPPSENRETLTITGPRDKLSDGINKAFELAGSMHSANVDISRSHITAPHGPQAHARNLTRYLEQRKEIERLERSFDAHIALPTDDGPVIWEIYSRIGRNIYPARAEITSIVNAHPPARFGHVEMDPFFHRHVRQQSAHIIKDNYGVHLVFPEDENHQILMVYEGKPVPGQEYELPKKFPSASELNEAEAALQEAREYLLSLIRDQKEIVKKSIEVPKKFHEKVQRFLSREQQDLAGGEIPVRVQVGEPIPRTLQAADDQVFLRGPAESVDTLINKVAQFIEEEKENERENGYATSFDFPKKFANILIGRKGENIRKYREEFDVEIQVNDGKVEIKGAKRRADAAKAKIIALGKKLEDEATHVLKIKPQYHRDLIGAKGNQVNRLQERYNVRVNFPRSANVVPANDDQSIADTASEVGGGHRFSRASQAPDEVIIRGPRKGADEAREELLNLLQYTIDHSHVASVSVALNQIPSLIGQGGREMESLRLSTGAQIDVPDFKRDGADPPKRVEIKVKGTKKQVEDAKKLLEERAKTFDESIVRTLEVDKKHHKALIGSGGANIRDIVTKAGGSDDRRDLARTVRFPRQESEDNTIVVEGNKLIVEKIVASIEEIIKQRENQVTETVEVAPEKHRVLIGRGGETRRDLESRFNVSVDVPKQSQTGQARSGVKIVGQLQDVEKCREHILGLVKNQEGATVQVPRRLHHSISDNGQFFRRLRNEHKVSVDHNGQQPPARSATTSPRVRINGGDLPLITDDQNSPDNFSWVIRDSDESAEEGDIPWTLRGPPESVIKARALLEAAIEQAQKQTVTGYLILPDPSKYRYVVGHGGSQVNSIRKQTGCKITVPRDQAKGEAIEIQGAKEGVEQAKDIILELVRNGGSGGNGVGRGGRKG
ncbi:hypothetical protein FGG08_000684 [Glutinoglossum americanum]|uniref:K Homology domain-containing protein n=1 Tax=Glutinoglossum americanum TaxID=1670608 RepID=A0A9P8ICH7_9PEZI|nr:hypothetical protein FGG08_000684 [Glutinoglossum americanum]